MLPGTLLELILCLLFVFVVGCLVCLWQVYIAAETGETIYYYLLFIQINCSLEMCSKKDMFLVTAVLLTGVLTMTCFIFVVCFYGLS